MKAGRIAVFILSAGFIIINGGCERKGEPVEYTARVGGEYLTLDMIRERLNGSRNMNEAMVREYVNQWLTSEILYQEARRRGLDRDERVLKPLQDVRRHLAINALLEDEIYSEENPLISESAIAAYYDSNQDEFIADKPLVEISFMLFEDRAAATSFRNSVVQGADWDAAAEDILRNIERSRSIIEIGERGFYKERDLYPAEIWRAARQLGAGGTSFPISTSVGFYIVRHHQTIREGGVYPLEYVSNEIRERLVIEMRQKSYEELLLELRKRYPIDITFETTQEEVFLP